jgi:O-antigen ligase
MASFLGFAVEGDRLWIGMPMRQRSMRPSLPGLCFVLLCILLTALLCVGGASRADVPGQIIARTLATLAVITAVLFAPLPRSGWPKAVPFLFLGAVLLTLFQLVPLPPSVWEKLPGRTLLLQAGTVGAQPWRPLSIEPSATFNSLGSLLVPGAVLILAAGMREGEEKRLISVFLTLIMVSALIGLMQLSGSIVSNPLVNDTAGAVSGLFANRNHFALFLALGCLFVPAWAVHKVTQVSWRLPTAVGLLLFLFLMILASGSRSGMLTGVIGATVGVWIVRMDLRRALALLPSRVRTAAMIALPVAVVAVLSISVALSRAQSITRTLLMNTDEDLRARAFPTVLRLISTYMPIGAGFGTFDTAFRIYEPLDLLKLTYFNHAHNDFAEVLLEGGVAALLLLAAAVVWWLTASVRAWRGGQLPRRTMQQLGSAVLLLIGIASVFDYPMRTPMMMAMVMIAGLWLAPRPTA